MKRKKMFFTIVLALAFVIYFGKIDVINAANVYTMDPSFLSQLKLKDISLNIKTLNKNEIDIRDSNITKLDVDSNNIAFLINNNEGNAVTYTGSPYLIRTKFENVGQIGNRFIDAIITVNRISLGNMWTSSGKRNPDGTMFFMIKGASVWFGCASTTLEDYVYSADQDIDISVNIVWSGTNTTVDYPFITGIFDLDANKNQTNNKTVEKWTAGAGYSKNYFVYSTTTLTHLNDTWSNGLENQNTTNDDERLLTGVYAESNNGAFSSSYREGHSATALKIYVTSPNDVNQLEPTLTSKITSSTDKSKSKVNSTTDNITYTLTQKLGTMFVDMFTPYNSLTMEDTIPSDLIYESATVKIQDGDSIIDITNNSEYGNLNYNPDTNKVSYNFNPNWLSNRNNYKGQTVTITIKTGVENIVSEYSNTAHTIINSVNNSTNNVINESDKKSVVYSYVSGTDGKELPSAISTTTGDYKIVDDTQYLIGELVTRNNSVSIGTKYRVYDSNEKILGTWELTNWNADSIQMTINGADFIGTWEYFDVGNINVIDLEDSNTYNASFEENDEDVISTIPLLQDDLDALADGKNISIYLDIKDVSDNISSDDKEELEKKLFENENIGEYLDIQLLKIVDDDNPTRIFETNEPVKIAFEIPEKLINKDSNVTRTYRLLQIADDGSLTESDIEINDGKVSMETSFFTTYVLTYSDKVEIQIDDKPTNNPKTGDNFISNFIILIISLHLLVLSLFYIKKNKHS